jgi:uncharacterized membrane protein
MSQLEIVTEALCRLLQRSEGFNVRLLVRSVGASGREGDGEVVSRIRRSRFHRRVAARVDQVGERKFRSWSCVSMSASQGGGRISKGMSQNHIQEHVDLIARHEEEFLAQRSASARLADRIASFAGSFSFVAVHLLFFAVWIAVNTLQIPNVPHFDHFPYSLLGTIVSAEALLLASFILMRQTRIGRRADERDHLMLQILLLTEKEITAVLAMNREIARDAGLHSVADKPDVKELSRRTSIEDVAQTIRESMPEAEEF